MGKFRNNKNRLMKEKALAYLGGKKCGVCGIDYLPIPCYDFHHTTGAKRENISKMISRGASWKDIKAELDRGKCMVMCKNHHAMFHALGIGLVR